MIRAHGTGIVEINVPTEASVGRSINRIKMEPVPHRLTVSDTSLVEAPRKWLRHKSVGARSSPIAVDNNNNNIQQKQDWESDKGDKARCNRGLSPVIPCSTMTDHDCRI